MEKIDFELKKKRDFYQYKRSVLFNSISFLFIFLTILNINLELFLSEVSSGKSILFVFSSSLIFAFFIHWSSKDLRLRLNKRGSYFISIIGVVQFIYLIGWTLSLSS